MSDAAEVMLNEVKKLVTEQVTAQLTARHNEETHKLRELIQAAEEDCLIAQSKLHAVIADKKMLLEEVRRDCEISSKQTAEIKSLREKMSSVCEILGITQENMVIGARDFEHQYQYAREHMKVLEKVMDILDIVSKIGGNWQGIHPMAEKLRRMKLVKKRENEE